MYVLVHHIVSDPGRFWSSASDALGDLPAGLKVHQTLAAKDGTRATCIWEAPSVADVQNFLDPITAGMARNEYRESENREGIALPAMASASA